MKIERHKHIDDEVLKEIKAGLKRSRQLKPHTLESVKEYAKEWIFIKNENDDMIGFMAVKKSQREEYEIELGFIYIFPSYDFEEFAYKLIEYIKKVYGTNRMYAEVLLTPIKKVFKKLGFKKLDEWDSEVRKGQKVELFTNQDITMIEENHFINYMKKILV